MAELRGQSHIQLPVAPGLKLRINGYGRLPSRDSYTRDIEDFTMFTMRIRPNDYDPTDYRGERDIFSSQDGLNFLKQRTELASQRFASNRVYTIDFEVRVSDASAGSFFQLHRGDAANFLMAYPDSIRFTAGQALQNTAVKRGDWLGEWQAIRLVFYPSSGRDSWYRFYVNGELALDTKGQLSGSSYKSGVILHFGSYRGVSAREAEVSYRKIRFSSGDLGTPD